MTRPKKGGEDVRDQIIRARLTLKEKIELLKIAEQAGMTSSDFIRAKTLQSAPITRKATPERQEFIKALAELGKLGSNVNQVARALNRRSEQGELIGLDQRTIECALNGVDTLTQRLLKLLE